MSGGVDSSVAAALLQERGFFITGVHIKMWSDPEIPCAFKEDRYDAMRAAAHLGIPFETWDLTAEYKHAVVEYMIAEYAAGRTPNPDVMCNREIKFGVFLRRALVEGADFIATGHYSRITKHKTRNTTQEYSLLQAKDINKDQSYFLWTLTQEQLRHCLFPIGDYTKPEVRAVAKKLGLPNAGKPDSQGICFIGEIDMAEFLKKYIPVCRGSVVTTSGNVVGEHDGLSFYTMGQRHGLGIGGSPSSGLRRSEGGIPYYVAEKNAKTNTLVVAEGPYDEKLFSSNLAVADVNWISGVPPRLPFVCEARIRYRQPLQKCVVSLCHPERSEARLPDGQGSRRDASPLAQHEMRVVFNEPQRAVTPGQSAVFYSKDEMLGGGIIR